MSEMSTEEAQAHADVDALMREEGVPDVALMREELDQYKALAGLLFDALEVYADPEDAEGELARETLKKAAELYGDLQIDHQVEVEGELDDGTSSG